MREFIVEADGGSRGNPGPAGYGAVVSDAATGETLAEEREFLGVVTNNVAEYRGLVAGLRAAHALDPEARVHVRMDSKLVVEQMSGRWQLKHPDMKLLALEASRIFPPNRVTYEWIPRAQNKHADRLANEAMDTGTAPRTPKGAASATGLASRTPKGAASATGLASRTPKGAASATGLASRTPNEAAGTTGSAPRGANDSSGAATAPRKGRGELRDQPPPTATLTTTEKFAADARAATNIANPAPTTTPGWGTGTGTGTPAPMPPPVTFILLRHGETPLTPQKRFSGSGGSDPALSATGRDQAERAATALARRGTVEAIIASPLTRTRETAAAVAARLGLDVTIEDGLRETDFGAWEGLTFAEARQRNPDDLTAWLTSPDAEPTGGGESFAATAIRVAAAQEKLLAAYAGRTVLLVTHVTPIKTLVRFALGAPPESMFRMELSAASLSVVAHYADGNASVRLFNETSHLR
ncbi:bifunctional RNase H/acid phosphatase [Streptomyces sp. NPDC056716]|uniref:bifunctional RNase H/acid phosphatase n=1 Tax=unclassified Streptomyces TaxID=2593676 RepID=UPI0036B6B5D7